MRLNNKKGFEMSFAFIFAMIVGAVILFLAIYGVSKLIGTSQNLHGSEVGKEINILLNPLETSIETSKEMSIELGQETKLYNKCYSEEGSFGRQGISASLQDFKGGWSKPGVESSLYNKYIFSRDSEQGKNFYLFSKNFEFPFKIGDIIIMTSGKYCFVSPPKVMEDEIQSIKDKGGMKNIDINYSKEDCINNSIKICFNPGCDISVYPLCSNCLNEYDFGYVEKKGEKMYFTKNLIYGAIFSDKGLYECNLKRMMKRVYQLSVLYKNQADIVSRKGCYWGLDSDTIIFGTAARNLNNSAELIGLQNIAESLKQKNQQALCKIW